MIEMRENRYDDLRKAEVNRSHEQNADKKNSGAAKPNNNDEAKPAGQTKDDYREEEYNPWS